MEVMHGSPGKQCCNVWDVCCVYTDRARRRTTLVTRRWRTTSSLTTRCRWSVLSGRNASGSLKPTMNNRWPYVNNNNAVFIRTSTNHVQQQAGMQDSVDTVQILLLLHMHSQLIVPERGVARVTWPLLELYTQWNIFRMFKATVFKFCARVGYVNC